MANTYSWRIVSIEKVPSYVTKPDEDVSLTGLENVVTSVDYEVTAVSDDGYTASQTATMPMPTPDPNNYLSFSDLTEEAVKDWMIGVWGGIDRTSILHHPQLDARINVQREEEQLQASTPQVADLPWG